MPYRSFMIGTWLTALVIVADGLRTLPDGERQFAVQEAQPPEQQRLLRNNARLRSSPTSTTISTPASNTSAW